MPNDISDVSYIHSIKYKFLTFDEFSSQKKFIKNHLERITILMLNCFKNNCHIDKNNTNNSDDLIKNYYNITKKMITELSSGNKWFFAMYKKNIIGLCYEFESEIFYSTEKIKTYKIISLDKTFINKIQSNVINVDKYIGGFCKDSNYKNVGVFLMNKITHYYKKNKIPKFYLTPESTIYKNNLEAINDNECVIDGQNYYDSNQKLINYYQKIGFSVENHLYEFIKCNSRNKYIFLNVMSRKTK